MTYVKQLQEYMSSLNYGSLSTLTGRYYAMDRDKRYERIKLAYDGMVNGTGEVVSPDRVIDVRHVGVSWVCQYRDVLTGDDTTLQWCG